MKQDRQGVRTASDLERKYDFGQLKNGNNSSLALSQMNQMLAQFMVEVNQKINNIYPVDSVYFSVSSDAPSFNGTWENVGTIALSDTVTCYAWQRTS